MDFFELDPLGNIDDPELCLLEGLPDGLPPLKNYCPMRGVAAATFWPAGAKLRLREENPGIKLSSFLGNTMRCLTVRTPLKEVIAAHCQGIEIEYLPFVLRDHRGRAYAKDCWFVNPLGARDCLDEQASGVVPGSRAIAQIVLDPRKVADLPALFRVDKDPTRYVVRADLADAIDKAKLTNVVLTKLTGAA